jgi:hypothetical protein
MTTILHHAALIDTSGMAALLAITLVVDRLRRSGSWRWQRSGVATNGPRRPIF